MPIPNQSLDQKIEEQTPIDLISLLKAIEAAINEKDKDNLKIAVDNLVVFLIGCFESNPLKQSDLPRALKKIQELPSNPSLIQLQILLQADELDKNYLSILSIALKLYEAKQWLAFNTVDTNLSILNIGLKVSHYGFDLSFYASSEPKQTLLGKPPKHEVPGFFKHRLQIIHPIYWNYDELGNVAYLTSQEKKKFKVRHEDPSKPLTRTNGTIPDGNYLYIISPKGGLYIANQSELNALNLRHSSIRAGQPVLCAGEITIKEGKITQIDNGSGHYKPSWSNLMMSCLYLKNKGILNEDCIIHTINHDGVVRKDITVEKLTKDAEYESFHAYTF